MQAFDAFIQELKTKAIEDQMNGDLTACYRNQYAAVMVGACKTAVKKDRERIKEQLKKKAHKKIIDLKGDGNTKRVIYVEEVLNIIEGK